MEYRKLYYKERKVNMELPKGIRTVHLNQNLYEKHDIEKAGFAEIKRLGNEETGYLTFWQNPTTKKLLLFIERQDGFFQYKGNGN